MGVEYDLRLQHLFISTCIMIMTMTMTENGCVWSMSGLTREETAGPVFRGEHLRPERRREKQKTKHIFSFQLTTSGGIENYA